MKSNFWSFGRVIVSCFYFTDDSLKIKALQLRNFTQNQQLLRDTVFITTPGTEKNPNVEYDVLPSSTAAPSLSSSSATSSSKPKNESKHLSTKVYVSAQDTSKSDSPKEGVKAPPPVSMRIPTDFVDESYFEPFCAMQSNAHKYLIWPDTPSDLTDWTYKRRRKCPKIVIPDDLMNTKRLKYSLNFDKNDPKLIPSFTNSSEDIQVVTLNDSCLAAYTNSCCIDSRGIPNVVHYVWYFKNEMKFYMFLSMISIIRYVRPCLILFHGEYLPFGMYWDYIIRIYPNILHVKRPRPLYIFGTKIHHHEHSGDIMRMEALMELGGIYFDTDVIVLRDLEPLREFDMTLCRQASGFMLNSFIMAKKNATFLILWMDGYRKDYKNDSYVYNSMWYNNDLAKNRTDLIHVEEGTLCAPAVLIGKPINSTMVYDWSSLYGFHLYARTIHFPWDVDWIKNFNTTMGSMVRHVVYGNKELCD